MGSKRVHIIVDQAILFGEIDELTAVVPACPTHSAKPPIAFSILQDGLH